MNVLVVDVGGTHVKILATGKKDKREFASGRRLTAPDGFKSPKTPSRLEVPNGIDWISWTCPPQPAC